MLSVDAFFRQVPKALAPKQRLIMEGAGWAIDSIYWSFDQAKAAARDSKFDATAHDIEHGMFVSCWSIVDQCHMLRKLLGELPLSPEGPTRTFIDKYENVTLIRNAMDHLHDKLDNLTKSKKQSPPVFGALSYCVVADDDFIELPDGTKMLAGCSVATLTAGSLTLNNHAWNIANPAGKKIEIPVGCFEFNAFDYTISFSELIEDLNALVAHYDTEIRRKVEDGIRAQAQERGIDADKVLKERGGGGFKILMKMKFDGLCADANSSAHD
jgi:hypothetical protein